MKELAANGITVARRTVTKYRKAMGIPSSRQRKEWEKGCPNSTSRSGHRVKLQAIEIN